jgi:methylmalonyl-CoA/ethylmalonyl-CoA epimerase
MLKRTIYVLFEFEVNRMETVIPTQIESIGQIMIPVHDLGRAVAFYRDALGLQFLFEVPGMAFFNCGGVRLMLGLPESPDVDHPASIIYYKVGDIQAAYGRMTARGVKFEGGPHLIARMDDHDLWMAFLRDSEGNLLGLMSELRRA